ncbi:MAG: shikimate kinase [Cyclobacteriaceae bacterium]|nr:shikimate kinase [Cyclobacteriaceae bacterium]
MKIFLIGLPGSGKTTLGKQLASKLKLPFIDLDKEIERMMNLPIKDIFKKHGQELFRETEKKLLHQLSEHSTDFVMATGGGAPVFFDNMTYMNQQGHTIFLDVSAREITKRILKTKIEERPLLAGAHPDELKDQIEFMRSQRITIYKQSKICLSGNALELSDLLKKLDLKGD